ncbi:MAG: hypothetical protein KC418_01390 [Anaerolineales bacterium]|nr:hypothetical protein [Anaerolineales bacterium]
MVRELEELLAAHVDDLNRGVDTTEHLVLRYAASFPDLPALLQLSRLLKKTLVPVQPRTLFIQQLKQELLQYPPADPAAAPTTNRLVMVGAAVGSLLSLTGVVLLWRLLARRTAPVPSSL